MLCLNGFRLARPDEIEIAPRDQMVGRLEAGLQAAAPVSDVGEKAGAPCCGGSRDFPPISGGAKHAGPAGPDRWLAAGMCQGIALPVIGRPRGSGGVCGEDIHFPTFLALVSRHRRSTSQALDSSVSRDSGCNHFLRNGLCQSPCPEVVLSSKARPVARLRARFPRTRELMCCETSSNQPRI